MAQLMSIKLSRFDACPWGFRLHGGKDFGAPLCIQKVNGGSPAEKAGLLAGDALIKVNGQEVYHLRHKEAQDFIVRAGNNFELTIQRGGSTWKPSVTPVGNTPVIGGSMSPVTKTSLAANKPAAAPIGTGHNVSARPFGTPTAQMNGSMSEPVKSITNKQYNSPVAMYSEETIAETLSAQAEVLAGGVLGVNFKKNEKNYTPANSEVFKMVQEIDNEPRTPEPVSEPSGPTVVPSAMTGLRHVSAPENRPTPPADAQQALPPGQNICADCERLIVGVFVRIKDKNLHVECFKCATCGSSLKNVGYYNINGKLYCDVHAKMAARQNPPAPNLEPIAVAPGSRAPAGAISAALAAAGAPSAYTPSSPGTMGPMPFHRRAVSLPIDEPHSLDYQTNGYSSVDGMIEPTSLPPLQQSSTATLPRPFKPSSSFGGAPKPFSVPSAPVSRPAPGPINRPTIAPAPVSVPAPAPAPAPAPVSAPAPAPAFNASKPAAAPAKVVWPPHSSSSEPVPDSLESTVISHEIIPAPIQAATQSYISETRVINRSFTSAQISSNINENVQPNLSKKFSVCSQEVSSITDRENMTHSEVVSSDRPRSPTPTKAATAGVVEAAEDKREMPPPPPPITTTPILSTAIQPVAVPACNMQLVPQNPQAPCALQLPCGNSIQGTINLQLVPVNTVTGQTVCNLQLVPIIQTLGNLPSVENTNPNPKNNPQVSNLKEICEACPEKSCDSCPQKSNPKPNPQPRMHPQPYPPPRTETHAETDYSHEVANISENKLLIEMNKPIPCYFDSGKPIEIDTKLLERSHTPKHLSQPLPSGIIKNTGSPLVSALTTASDRPYSPLGTFQPIENLETARETLSPVLAARVRRSGDTPVLPTGRAEQMVHWEKQAQKAEALAKPVAKMNMLTALTTAPDKPYAPLTIGAGAFRPVSGKDNHSNTRSQEYQQQQHKQLPPSEPSPSITKTSGNQTPTIQISEAPKFTTLGKQSTTSKLSKTELELLHSSQISLETRCLSPRVSPSRSTPSSISHLTGLHKPATIPIYQQFIGEIPVGRPNTPKCPMVDSPRAQSPAPAHIMETTKKQHLSKDEIQSLQQSSYHHQVEVAGLAHRPGSGLGEPIDPMYPLREGEQYISQSPAQNHLPDSSHKDHLSKGQIQSLQQSSYHHQVELAGLTHRPGSGLGEPIEPIYPIKNQEQHTLQSDRYIGKEIKTSNMNMHEEQKQSQLQKSMKEETISTSGNERKITRRHVTEEFERNTYSMSAQVKHTSNTTAALKAQQKTLAEQAQQIMQSKSIGQGLASLNEKIIREPPPQRRQSLAETGPSFDTKVIPPKPFGEVIQPGPISTPKAFAPQNQQPKQSQALIQQTQMKNPTKFQPVKPSPLATGSGAAPASTIPKPSAIRPTSLPDQNKASPLKPTPSSTKRSSISSAPKSVDVTNPPGPLPDAGAGGGKAGAAFAGATAPKRGRGVLNQPGMAGTRVPLCAHCNVQIRGPFITALGKIWCPDHFVCVNAQCRRPLADIGFVEEKGQLYCEYCFEQFIAPSCDKCHNKIKGDCLNAIGKHFHPECFLCAYCGKLFGNNPFFLEDGLPYCESDWNELFTTKCFACGFPIEAGDRWVEALNNNYHSQCFNCTNCKKNLEGQSFYAKGGRPFCKAHAR